MKACIRSILVSGVAWLLTGTAAGSVAFNFDSGPQFSSTPLNQSSGGITAHFTTLGTAYSIQQPAVAIGLTPAGFSGLCLAPTSVYASDLKISFDHTLNAASILYAPQELATDSSCTMRITAYLGTTYVGTNTHVNQPGTWPSGTLSFSSAQPFDNVVIHYDSPPPTGGDYGPIFVADNLSVTQSPEPSTVAMLLAGAMALIVWRLRRRT